ncbi:MULTISPECIES: GspH/FimT family protein [Ramlibacter]|uniref:Type II secretion system protein H n=1 Tax=Ramlibacter aquaticus TaxID=2780094 RepID=A0ABR9SHZ1_9BURK|nr:MULTISPECIES: GspH/FimT family protein [Ramlibacter]MBE7941967.1 GspH/FimT family pseudopilin [Ramlibacter aquaticus]
MPAARPVFAPSPANPRRSRGLTLVELLVVLALVAILLGLGVPSFARLLERTRVSTAAQRLQSHLALARSEAVRRGLRVTLCKSADGLVCATTGGWEQGWILFSDAQATGRPAGPPLTRGQALPPSVTVNGTGSLGSYVSYTEAGQPQLLSGGFQAGTLHVCGTPGSEGRDLVLSRAGRLRSDASANPCP